MADLAVNQKRAAAMLGISVNTFKRNVRPDLPRIVIGSAVRYRVKDLEDLLDRRVTEVT